MEYRKLNNGIKMPMLGLGTYLSKDPEECRDIVSEALGMGYRLIDTAQFYFNEEYVGAGIAASGIPREEVFVTTKVWFNRYEDAYDSVLESLEKLKTGYIDLVLLHWPFGNTYKAWRDLEKLYREGVVKAIGVSNFSAARLVDLVLRNDVTPAVNQIETNLVAQQRECHLWMEKYGVAHESYAPLARGRVDELYDNEIFGGICARYDFFKSSLNTSVIGVLINPGAIAFAVIPRDATSAAMDFVIAIIPPLLAA